MINIYSIKEIIDASNNILNRTVSKNNVTSEKNSKTKKNIILKKDQPLILTDVVINEDQIQSDFNKIDLKIKLKEKKTIKPINNEKLFDQLYLKLNKKIKKNTLKLIFDLQKEVSDIKGVKNFLQISIKQAKRQISKLIKELKNVNIFKKKLENEKITLNTKITELSELLDVSQNETQNLKINKNK